VIFRPSLILVFALVCASYYRHHTLYKYIFGKRTITQLNQVEPHSIECIRIARPLNEAFTEDPSICAKPPPAPTPEPVLSGTIEIEQSDVGGSAPSKKDTKKKKASR
jgi:hypothetical protein